MGRAIKNMNRQRPYLVDTLKDDIGNEFTILTDHGFEVEKEEALRVIRELQKTYENEEYLKYLNDLRGYQNLLKAGYEYDRKYERFGRKVYFFKAFKKSYVRGWGFNCDFCNCKVHTNTHKGYWRINEQDTYGSGPLEVRACSETCVKQVWDEEWPVILKTFKIKEGEKHCRFIFCVP